MQITGASGNKYNYGQMSMDRRYPDLNGEDKSFGNAVEKVEKEEKGEALSIAIAGKGTIGHGVRAVLLEESTPEPFPVASA